MRDNPFRYLLLEDLSLHHPDSGPNRRVDSGCVSAAPVDPRSQIEFYRRVKITPFQGSLLRRCELKELGRRFVTADRRGSNNEGIDTTWIGEAKVDRDLSPEGRPDDGRRLETDGVHDGRDVIEVGEFSRLKLSFAEATKVEPGHTEVPCELSELRVPHPAVRHPGVQKDNGFSVTRVFIVQTRAIDIDATMPVIAYHLLLLVAGTSRLQSEKADHYQVSPEAESHLFSTGLTINNESARLVPWLEAEASTATPGSPLEHLQVAVGITGCDSGAPPDVFVSLLP